MKNISLKNGNKVKTITKKGLAVLLATTMIGTVFAGCSKNSLFDDTLLENAQVMYINNQDTNTTEPVIVYKYHNTCSTGEHYKSVISGNAYHIADVKIKSETDESGSVNTKDYWYKCDFDQNISIKEYDVYFKTIESVLTKEELARAEKGEFTDADIAEVQSRLTEEAKTLSKN